LTFTITSLANNNDDGPVRKAFWYLVASSWLCWPRPLVFHPICLKAFIVSVQGEFKERSFFEESSMGSVIVFLGSSVTFQCVFSYRKWKYRDDEPPSRYLFPASMRSELNKPEGSLVEALVLTNLCHNIIVSIFSTYLLFFRKFQFQGHNILLCQWSDLGAVPDETLDPTVKYLLMITLAYMTVEMTNLIPSFLFYSDLYPVLMSKRDYRLWFGFHSVIFAGLLFCIARSSGFVGFVWGIWGEILAIVSLFCAPQFIGHWRKRHFIAESIQLIIILLNRVIPISWLIFITFCQVNDHDGFCKLIFSISLIPQLILLILIGSYNVMLAYNMIQNVKLLFIYLRT
jgi:hypothetical protein